MSRSTWRAIGLLLLVPSVLIGILPLLASSTDMTSSWSAFTIASGDKVFVEFGHTASGASYADVDPLVWLGAAFGELILVAVHLMKPERKSRFIVNLR